MQAAALTEALGSLPTGGALGLSLADVPLDELLFTLHTGRFTGALRLGPEDGPDRVYLREGGVVGLVPPAGHDAPALGDLLVQMKLLSEATLAALWEDAAPEDGVALAHALAEHQFVAAEDLARAVEEHARRRLFALYDSPDAPVDLRGGLERLAHFSPIYLDVKPVIAFGTVVKASPARKRDALDRVRGKQVRLIVEYDERRNSYGLPPPVLQALRDLAGGVKMREGVALPGLSLEETAGVLLLFERMSLLEVR